MRYRMLPVLSTEDRHVAVLTSTAIKFRHHAHGVRAHCVVAPELVVTQEGNELRLLDMQGRARDLSDLRAKSPEGFDRVSAWSRAHVRHDAMAGDGGNTQTV